jgi:NAD-dependent deacetylase
VPDIDVQQARELLHAAERITVLTGAGISTDSGIPDFRGPNGVWTKDPKAEQASNIRVYVTDPEVRKARWRSWLASTERERPEPNDGHRALVELERSGRLHTLITQNVDGLHVAAGADAERIVEIHGTTRDVVCLDCGERAPMERALERVRAGEEDPPCRSCGGLLKSATISFGQGLVHRDLMRADQAARECDLMLAVGTTLAVYPIAEVVPIAASHGAPVIILNGDPTEMDDLATVLLRGRIGELLPALVAGIPALD